MSNLMIISNPSKIKSTELVDIINEFRKTEGNNAELQHNDFMKKIRKEVEILKNLGLEGQGNFSQSSYVNSQNKEQPCFELNRDGMLQMLNSESAYVRYKTIEYINKLEEKLKCPKDSYMIEDPIERAKAWVNSLNGGQVKPIVASYFLGSVRGHSVVATWCKCIGRLNDEN